ncbi:MAG TPA: penicillin acylase family protein [Pseudonocardiaceae bacterium]|nr:penicillin acylase family protein [Pseudonocardiaceae bacterium]
MTLRKRLRWRVPVIAVCAALTVLGTGVAASAATPNGDGATVSLVGQPAGPNGYLAEIRRTEYGIPHILAGSFGSLGYGYGYAFAQDNFCELSQRVLAIRGQRSEYFGPTADSGDPLDPATNLASDTYFTGLRQSGVVQKLVDQPAPLGPTAQVRQLVDGYVAGFNKYLADTGVAHLPDPTCRGAAWVGPITALDMWIDIYDIQQLGGIAQAKQQIGAATPPTVTTQKAAVAPELPSASRDAFGSNGWAIGKDATVGGDGMVLANPHFPWLGTERFYQVQLTIPGVLDVTGASLYGTPVVELGHTQSLAWTHTVSTAQRLTLYQLALVPGNPTSYLVDGKPEAMTTRTVTVAVRGADGKVTPTRQTLYYTRFGPMVGGQGWTTSTGFAVDDVNSQNMRAMNEWLAMDESENLSQLQRAQNTYQGIPFTYTIAADSTGKAYFADASVVPDVTDAKAARCVDTPQGKAVFPDTFILDGSTSTCGWGNDPTAIQPGIFGPGSVPKLTSTSYVANSNNTPWLVNANTPITSYPAIFGDQPGTQPAPRPQLSLNMIGERIAGTDGFGPPGFTLSSLRQTALGDRVQTAENGNRDDVVAMCTKNPVLTATDGTKVDVSAACQALANWDLKADVDSRGIALWDQFFNGLNGPGVQHNAWWTVPYEANSPLTTPRGINATDPDVPRIFADTVELLNADHVAPDAGLGSLQQYQGIPIPGCPDAFGCFNAISPSTDLTSSGTYGPVNFGSSFIMAVELTPKGPQARTVLTYSESTNPASPHFTDQTRLFSQHRWVTDRFSDADIDTSPDLRVSIVRG